MPSYYCPDLNPDSTTISIAGEEFHHLSHVKRIAIGDTIKLNSGTGLIAWGNISELGKREAKIELSSCDQHPHPDPGFAIAFALLKNRHDELLVEKCTELGVSTFFPLFSEHGVRIPTANAISRFQRITLAAIKQCDNPWLPLVQPVQSLDTALQNIKSKGYQAVLCSERRPEKWLHNLQLSHPPCFLIGPEGGWSDSEYELFASYQIPEISISRLILRAETAAIAIAAQFATTLIKLS